MFQYSTPSPLGAPTSASVLGNHGPYKNGDPITLLCDVKGDSKGSLSFIWLRDGKEIDGASASEHTFIGHSFMSGVFACRAGNSAGTVRSNNVTIEICKSDVLHSRGKTDTESGRQILGHRNPDKCGLGRAASTTQQSTEGIDDPFIEQYPWVVSIGFQLCNGSWIHKCGGSIIGEMSILTAAHCNAPK